MLLDLNDVLRRRGRVMTRAIHLDAGSLDDIELSQPAVGEIRIENTRRNLVIKGKVDTSVWISCARCLEPFEQEMRLELEAVAPLALFDLAPINESPDWDDDEDEAEIDDETRALFAGNSLDVSELIRQTIWLHTPIKPLCTPDCAGLEQHIPAGDSGDPRLEQLKRWQQNHR